MRSAGRILVVALALWTPFCGGDPTPLGVEPDPPVAEDDPPVVVEDRGDPAVSITSSDMYQRIAYIASDDMEGRATPSPGLEETARYVAAEFESFGLVPVGDAGSLIQRFPLPTTGSDPSTAPNVVGILPGGDPELRDTYVVLSAHMDHVGVRGPDATGDSIYNGADDNASGTAALVEIAEAVAELDPPPRRSLAFLAFGGEERGLRGSRYFADQPTIPIPSIVAAINMDMIGRNVADSLVVIGQEYSTLGAVVRRVAADHPDLGLTVYGDRRTSDRLVHRSDQHSFFRHGVPILWFFTGFHEDYHRPSDEVDRIDADKATRVARFVFFTALEIAQSTERPEWTTADTGEAAGWFMESRISSGARTRHRPSPDR